MHGSMRMHQRISIFCPTVSNYWVLNAAGHLAAFWRWYNHQSSKSVVQSIGRACQLQGVSCKLFPSTWLNLVPKFPDQLKHAKTKSTFRFSWKLENPSPIQLPNTLCNMNKYVPSSRTRCDQKESSENSSRRDPPRFFWMWRSQLMSPSCKPVD